MRSVSVGRSPAITSSSKQKLRLGGERTGHFEPLAVRQRQRRGDPVPFVEQVEPLQQCPCARARASPTSWRCRSAPMVTLSSTLSPGNGRTIWNVRAMPRRQIASAGRPWTGFAGEHDRARIRRHCAGDHVEQRRLAGAVRADDGEDRARRHRKADPVDRDQAAEALADGLSTVRSAVICRPSPRRAGAPAAATRRRAAPRSRAADKGRRKPASRPADRCRTRSSPSAALRRVP